MRLKLRCEMNETGLIPYNYNHQLQNVIYRLIQKSSPEFSAFLHNIGFIDGNKPFKLFTFSKLLFADYTATQRGFEGVKEFSILISTPIKESYEHLVLGIFAKQEFELFFSEKHSVKVSISSVESLPEAVIESEMHFLTLSPIVTSIDNKTEDYGGQHFLDCMNPEERERYISNIYQNLLRKHRVIYKEEYGGDDRFEFAFDVDYILKRQGKIRKKINFKRDTTSGKYIQIIGMEAPFTIKTDPELIKIGYQCGFGEKNSAGFGMVERTI